MSNPASWGVERLILQSMEDSAARELLRRYRGVFVNAAKVIYIEGIDLEGKVIWLFENMIVRKRQSLINMIRSDTFQGHDEDTKSKIVGGYFKRTCSTSGKDALLREFGNHSKTVSLDAIVQECSEETDGETASNENSIVYSSGIEGVNLGYLNDLLKELSYSERIVFAFRSYGILNSLLLDDCDWKHLADMSGVSEEEIDKMLDMEITGNSTRERPISSKFTGKLLGLSSAYVDKIYQRVKEKLQSNYNNLA